MYALRGLVDGSWDNYWFVGTWALILWAMMAGGGLGIFVDVPSLIMVGGGSVDRGASLFSHGLCQKLRQDAQERVFP